MYTKMNNRLQSPRKSLIAGALRLVTTRPTVFLATLRSFLLFWRTHILLRILHLPGLHCEDNVRLQKLSSVVVECPKAQIVIGSNCVIYEDCRLEAYGSGEIIIGKNSVLGGLRAISRERIRLGERVLASWGVLIQDFDPHPIEAELRGRQVEQIAANMLPRFVSMENRLKDSLPWDFPSEAITIGNDVWLGAHSILLKGVVLGDGCIVAAGAVVTRGNYPSGSILAGNPARVVRPRRATRMTVLPFGNLDSR